MKLGKIIYFKQRRCRGVLMNKEKKKLKAERLKSFQEFNHLSDDEMALFVYVHKRENVYKIIIVILIIAILLLLVLM